MARDKRAAALKQKRRTERQAERNTEAEKIFRDFKEYQNRRGINVKVKKEKVYRMAREIEREVIAESIIDSVIAVMYCLSMYCGFGQNRLFEYSRKVQRIITAVGQEVRPLNRLEEELKTEIGLDIRGMVKGYAPYNGEKSRDNAKNRASLIIEYAPNGLIMCLYVLYFDYGYKKKRMARIAEQAKSVLISHAENFTIKELSEYLRRKSGISINSDGTVECVPRRKNQSKER